MSTSPPHQSPQSAVTEGQQLNQALTSFVHHQHGNPSNAPEQSDAPVSTAAPVSSSNTTIFIEKPRKALTAYNIFFKDERAKMVEEQKKTGNRIGFAGMARAVSAKWKQIDPELKKHYDALAAHEKARHARETTAWKNMKKNAVVSQQKKQQQQTSTAARPTPPSQDMHKLSPEEVARRLSRRVSFDQSTRGGLSPVRSSSSAVPLTMPHGMRPLPSHPPLWMGHPRGDPATTTTSQPQQVQPQQVTSMNHQDDFLPSFEDFMRQQEFPPPVPQQQTLRESSLSLSSSSSSFGAKRSNGSSSSSDPLLKSFLHFDSLEPEPIEEQKQQQQQHQTNNNNFSVQSDALMDRMGSEGTDLFLSIFQV